MPLNSFKDELVLNEASQSVLRCYSSGLRVPVLEESCNIVWTLEASLKDGEDLFITGDLAVLGNWQPDSALQLHPVKGGKLWKCEIKVPCGVNFKYNYFTINKEASHYILWKPGPKFSLSVPLKPQVNDKISVRDNWITFKKPCPAPFIWGSWAKDIDLIENPSSNSRALTDAKNSCDTHLHHPIEEPWFLYSTIPLSIEDPTPAKLRSEEQRSFMLRDDGKSTTILINTSICTMQRIAVLENDKLVELLLEPVKSDVQCDSVYVGVVTQLLPHMGGALVDIGSSRPAFMDIDQNRKPFVIPSFNLEKSDTFASEGDQANANNVSEDFDDFFSSNQSEGLINDEADELDILDEKGHKNGSLFDYDKLAKNFEKESSLLLKEQTGMGKYWDSIGTGAKIIVQVFKEGLGTKRPSVTPYPHLRSRFWILLTRCNRIGVSRKIIGSERLRLKVIAKILQPPGFGLTVRTVAAGHPWKELHKDLKGLLATWKNITESAKSAVLAAEDGVEGAVPVILHRAMGQTLSVVQDYFNEKVKKMVVDSQRTYHEVTSYLQDVAPDLCDRVELYAKKNTLFGEFKIEEEINNILSKRVPLTNGGSLVIEQTEALVSIDVNGGHVMFGQGTSPAKAVLDVNLAAAKQIARELRLRDIGGIIVVDFIDMDDDGNKRLVYEEMKRAVESDRSTVKVSELSKHGLMEITRKRVRPSVTFMVSEPCACCHATGRVEALETVFSKIEQEICRSLAEREREADAQSPKSWPKFLLRVDHQMCNYLTAGKKTKLGVLSSSLKVWIVLKVAREFGRGSFEVKAFGEDKKTALKINHAPIAMIRQPADNKQVTVLTIKKAKGRKIHSLSSDSDLS